MSDVVILHCDETADPIAADAIGHLGGLVQDGVVKRFWQAQTLSPVGRSAQAISWTENEPADVDLLTALSAVRGIKRIRLVTIATNALSMNSLVSLRNRAEGLATMLAETQPAGIPFADVRLIAPTDLGEQTHLTGLFSAHAAANIVFYPEDRISDAGFALPLSAAEPATVGLHVAVETATQVGLWHDMDSAPVDAAAPGLMSGDIRVWLSRSFARIAIAPPLPVERAIAASEVLPVPFGTEPAPIPRQTAARYAEHLVDKVDELQFHEPQAFAGTRRNVAGRPAIELLFREGAAYLRDLPYQFRHGAAADLSYTAGEALTAALGSSSAVEVVWKGKVADDDGTLPPPVDVDELRKRLLERLRRPESPSFDQNIWSSLVDDIFALVDGGATSEGTLPPSIGAERVAVVDPRAIAPDPALGLESVVQAIDSEPLDTEEPTAVGRLSARIRAEIVRSDRYVDALLATITEQLDQLRSRRTPLLTILAWGAGIVMAAIIGVIVVFSGFAETIGVDSWDASTRLRLSLIGSGVLLVMLSALLAAGLRGHQALPVGFGAAAIVVFAGGTISLVNWKVSVSLPDPIGTIRLGELTFVLTIVALFVLVLMFCAAQHTQRGRIASRLTGVLAIGVATVVTVISVVRPGSWHSTIATDELRSIGIRWVALLCFAFVTVLLATLVLRVRERLTVDRLSAHLMWASTSAEMAVIERARLAQALRQWHGSAVALARTVWSPFGTVDESRESVATEAAVNGEIRKMQIYIHEPREEDLLGVMSRIRQEVADPGWLRRQYQVAVDAFQPRYAFRTGRALDLGSVRRPEADPAPEDPSLGAGSPGDGIRWVFADMLLGGTFDDELSAVGSKVALDAVLEMYLARGSVGNGEDADIASFGGALVAGEAPSLPVHLFSKVGLPVAGDPKAQFSTEIWWPRGISRPRTSRSAEMHEAIVSTDNPRGLVVSFLRSDWSAALPLKLLPFDLSMEADTGRAPSPTEWPADDSSDVM